METVMTPEQEISSLKSQVDGYYQELERLRPALELAQGELGRRTEQLKYAEQARDKARVEDERMTTELRRANDRIRELNEEVDQLRTRVKDLDAEALNYARQLEAIGKKTPADTSVEHLASRVLTLSKALTDTQGDQARRTETFREQMGRYSEKLTQAREERDKWQAKSMEMAEKVGTLAEGLWDVRELARKNESSRREILQALDALMDVRQRFALPESSLDHPTALARVRAVSAENFRKRLTPFLEPLRKLAAQGDMFALMLQSVDFLLGMAASPRLTVGPLTPEREQEFMEVLKTGASQPEPLILARPCCGAPVEGGPLHGAHHPQCPERGRLVP
jgi:uncharacterized coiled-coil DUF342 family protein